MNNFQLFDGLTTQDIDRIATEVELQQRLDASEEARDVQTILLEQLHERIEELEAQQAADGALFLENARLTGMLQRRQMDVQMTTFQLAATVIELREAHQEISRLQRAEYLRLPLMRRQVSSYNSEGSYWERANTNGRTRSGNNRGEA